jgi:diaminohydroxyphosphoribosylaminopyrimidine deaminase/5-amino-6-(5-phosphoribosylamino)uracil reductase
VIAGRRAVPASAALYRRDPLFYTIAPLDTDVEQVVTGGRDAVDLGAVMKDLGARGYVEVMVEGGATLARALIEAGHVDRIVLYLAAKIGAGVGLGAFAGEFKTISDAIELSIVAVDRIGEDIRVEAKVGL